MTRLLASPPIRRPRLGVGEWSSHSGTTPGTCSERSFAFEDITEQRELETRLAEILGRVTDAFYALDDDFRFTHVNDQAEELLQASADELPVRNCGTISRGC